MKVKEELEGELKPLDRPLRNFLNSLIFVIRTVRAKAISGAGCGLETQKMGTWEPLLSMRAPGGALASLLLLGLIGKWFLTRTTMSL